MVAQWLSEGVCLVGRYGNAACGAWLLVHGGEAALVEAPQRSLGGPAPWEDVAAVLDDVGARARWLLFTHEHADHLSGYRAFRRRFPEAHAVVHASFLEEPWVGLERLRFDGPGDEVFAGEEHELSVGGEPLFLLHAPKHSEQDTLVFFRGVAITGDWTLGPCPDRVGPASRVARTIERVTEALHRWRYHTHTVASAHGNEVRRVARFEDLLLEMHAYWSSLAHR